MIDFLAMLFEMGAVEPDGVPWLVVYGMASFVLILCGAIAKLFLALMKKDEELRLCWEARLDRAERMIAGLEDTRHEGENPGDEDESGTSGGEGGDNASPPPAAPG